MLFQAVLPRIAERANPLAIVDHLQRAALVTERTELLMLFNLESGSCVTAALTAVPAREPEFAVHTFQGEALARALLLAAFAANADSHETVVAEAVAHDALADGRVHVVAANRAF